MVAPGGALIARGSDDGTKLTFPDGEGLESMEWLLETPNAVKGSSDREHGRKIYSHMMSQSPKPEFVEMLFQVDSTVGMTPEQRMAFFLDNHSFRRHYALNLIQDEDRKPGDVRIANEMKRSLDHWRERFRSDEGLFAMTVQNVLVALEPAGASDER